ncbi:hypothetical protein [Flavobacterium columnare]|uniref:hypothetical protein n=2 Tax=Flavobacteriaceae TaxID=49546 RepID=UPI000B5B8F7D|nr:hypothetical protein [Flavobacterium columnare]OXA74197.1 hypothetical protein B0A56_12825 [Flavobacterium columnare NBRC 100251 = ATCC 23463]
MEKYPLFILKSIDIFMKWDIIINSKDVSGGLDISIIPENDVVRFIILQYKVWSLPKLINHVSESLSTGIEHAHIRNYSDMDWEDKAWAKNVKGSELEAGEMFLVHDIIGETTIKEALFDKILYDYGSKLLEIYQNDKTLPNSWVLEMHQALEKLKVKIDKENLT